MKKKLGTYSAEGKALVEAFDKATKDKLRNPRDLGLCAAVVSTKRACLQKTAQMFAAEARGSSKSFGARCQKMTAAGWNLRHGKAEREHLDESDSAARFIDAAEADPWQNGRRVGQQRFGGNVAEEEAAARFGAQHAVPKSTPTEQTKEALGVFILACLVETAFKLHAPGTTEYEAAQCVSQNPTVQALRDDCVFQAHHRCDPNYGLDSGALACLEKALPYDELARAKIGFFKAIICPHDGMLDELEAKHRELASKSPWEGDVCAQKLLDALRSVTLDIAYAGMRRSFFEAEARRQKKSPGQLPLPSSGDKKNGERPLAEDTFHQLLRPPVRY